MHKGVIKQNETIAAKVHGISVWIIYIHSQQHLPRLGDTLTKAGQSRWEDHEMAGDKHIT